MEVCRATKRNGEPCTLPANGKHGFCWAHDPGNAEARRRRAAKGGYGKANREVRDLKGEIKDIIAEVKTGELDRNNAAVMLQGYRALKDYIELERRIKETDEIEERISRLERAATARGGNRWGA